MVDITHKSNTLREAKAGAIVRVSSQETIDAINEGRVPKGNVFEIARAAGLFAVKQTSNVIPDCHPLPVEYTHIDYSIEGMDIKIEIDVKTVYKTGVEVEAMHGASVVALTMYDMLKPIDKGVEIFNVKLLRKKGGKSSFGTKLKRTFKAGVIVCSDSISQGIKKDKAGLVICEKLKAKEVEVPFYEVIPDEMSVLQEKVNQLYDEYYDMVIVTGGTGLSPRDITPEALEPLIERRMPGVEEAIRKYGQERTPYAMLSRSIVGTKGSTVIMGIPGSTKGAEESMDAIFPAIMHVFGVLKGARHD